MNVTRNILLSESIGPTRAKEIFEYAELEGFDPNANYWIAHQEQGHCSLFVEGDNFSLAYFDPETNKWNANSPPDC